MARIAIVDLLFNWPPDGGARTDVFEIALRLSADHDVCLFVPDFNHHFPRGQIRTKLPLQIKAISFDSSNFLPLKIASRFKEEVDRYTPDFVFITDGWYLKPYLINALKEYRPIVRFYAYEALCLKSHGHYYRNDRVCDKDYLRGPLESVFTCIGCSLRWLSFTADKHFHHEFSIAYVLSPHYRTLVKKALSNASKIIVYNDFIRNKILPFNKNVVVIPSGVDTKLFKPQEQEITGNRKPHILMVGRIDDRLKGFYVLREACQKLREENYDFQLLLTTKKEFEDEYISSVGWLSQEELAKLYQQADICVVPSVWPEPFGIVALEAMASGKPVIVTRVGGLQKILKDSIEGFIIEPNDSNALASRLKQLLDDTRLRKDMGSAGRRRAQELYDWDIVYKTYYLELFRDAKKDLIAGVTNGKEAYLGPRTVQLDITNKCNIDCLYCWARSPLLKEKAASPEWHVRQLPLTMIKQLIDDLGMLRTEYIRIVGGGEPFMHPDIMEILEYIKLKGIRCEVSTNFTLVTEDRAKRIIEMGVDSLVINLWAGTAKTYAKLHPKTTEETFRRTIEILKLIASIKKSAHADRPLIFLQNVISNMNFREIEQMFDVAQETGAQICYFAVMDAVAGYTDMLLLSEQERKELLERFGALKPRMEELVSKYNVRFCELDEFLRRIASKKASLGIYDEEDVTKMPCYAGWVYSRITADGNVNFCPKTDEYPLGNLYKNSFKEIWNSCEYGEFRNRLLTHRHLPHQPLRCNKICDNRLDNHYVHRIMQESCAEFKTQ